MNQMSPVGPGNDRALLLSQHQYISNTRYLDDLQQDLNRAREINEAGFRATEQVRHGLHRMIAEGRMAEQVLALLEQQGGSDAVFNQLGSDVVNLICNAPRLLTASNRVISQPPSTPATLPPPPPVQASNYTPASAVNHGQMQMLHDATSPQTQTSNLSYYPVPHPVPVPQAAATSQSVPRPVSVPLNRPMPNTMGPQNIPSSVLQQVNPHRNPTRTPSHPNTRAPAPPTAHPTHPPPSSAPGPPPQAGQPSPVTSIPASSSSTRRQPLSGQAAAQQVQEWADNPSGPPTCQIGDSPYVALRSGAGKFNYGYYDSSGKFQSLLREQMYHRLVAEGYVYHEQVQQLAASRSQPPLDQPAPSTMIALPAAEPASRRSVSIPMSSPTASTAPITHSSAILPPQPMQVPPSQPTSVARGSAVPPTPPMQTALAPPTASSSQILQNAPNLPDNQAQRSTYLQIASSSSSVSFSTLRRPPNRKTLASDIIRALGTPSPAVSPQRQNSEGLKRSVSSVSSPAQQSPAKRRAVEVESPPTTVANVAPYTSVLSFKINAERRLASPRKPSLPAAKSSGQLTLPEPPSVKAEPLKTDALSISSSRIATVLPLVEASTSSGDSEVVETDVHKKVSPHKPPDDVQSVPTEEQTISSRIPVSNEPEPVPSGSGRASTPLFLPSNSSTPEPSATPSRTYKSNNRAYIEVPDSPSWVSHEQRKQSLKRQDSASASVSASRRSSVSSIPTQNVNVDSPKEVQALEQSYSRLQERPCRWKACEVVLNSANNLVKHLEEHKEEQRMQKSLTCLWHQCGRHFTQKIGFYQHLLGHARHPIYCPYLDCGQTFRTARQLVQHTEKKHTDDELRRDTIPFKCPPTTPPPTSVVPAYMVEARAVAGCAIPKERQTALRIWTEKNITAPLNIPQTYNAARPLDESAGNAEGGIDVSDYQFLAFSSAYTTNPSEASRRIRDLGNLASSEVSQMASEGLVLWPPVVVKDEEEDASILDKAELQDNIIE